MDNKSREQSSNQQKEQHVVRITRNMGGKSRDELVAFIDKKLAEYKGTQDGGATEGTHGIPLLVFKTSKDAHVFANALSQATNYPREHIEVKPRGTARISGRLHGET